MIIVSKLGPFIFLFRRKCYVITLCLHIRKTTFLHRKTIIMMILKEFNLLTNLILRYWPNYKIIIAKDENDELRDGSWKQIKTLLSESERYWRLTGSKETISIQLNPTNLKVFGAQWQEGREGLTPIVKQPLDPAPTQLTVVCKGFGLFVFWIPNGFAQRTHSFRYLIKISKHSRKLDVMIINKEISVGYNMEVIWKVVSMN